MPRNVEITPGYVVEFPDSMSEAQVNSASARLYSQAKASAGPSLLERGNAAYAEDVKQKQDRVIGIGKSAAGLIHGGGQLLRNAPIVGPMLNALPSAETGSSLLTPPVNSDERAGKFIGDTAAFFLPGSALAKAKAAVATGSGILDALVGAGLEGASAAGVGSAQQGTTEGAGKTAAAGMAGTLATQGGLQTVAKGAGWLGQRIERALLKPTMATLEGQSEKELVKKIYQYDVGGTLGQSYDKVQAKLSALSTQLRGVLATSSAKGAGISINQVAKDTADSYLNNPQAKAAMSRILDHVEFELNKRGLAAGSGVVDLADGNVVKQAVGDMGAWLHDLRGNAVSDADKVTEDVANRFYTKLKTSIEQNATGPVAAINKQISDLLPIRQAIIRRIPVTDRANVLNMADLIGLSTHTLGLSVANRILNSGRAANLLVKGGAATAAKAGQAAAVIGRGAASQVPE